MRLKKRIIRERSKEDLKSTQFLNLEQLNLAKLENLHLCENLRWLIARGNRISDDEGLENLKHLWYLDLSNNNLTSISTLDRFLGLGTLILSNNNLRWKDLNYIKHNHFLSISLHGNPGLDSDPYYRIHVIDCLPLIWELDGRLVTVTERRHVKQFFIDTEFSQHPVRHKLSKSFKTTLAKNLGTNGIVSQQCNYIYCKFPMSETHTKQTDERRLKYLTGMVEEDILIWAKELHAQDPGKPSDEHFLVELLEYRPQEVERCNMVLLLLVISLEFKLPTSLVHRVLNTANLDFIGSVSTMKIFLLPRAFRTKVIQVLLNAAKVDRDNNVVSVKKKCEGGLYPQLFMCLYHTVAQLTRISQSTQSNMENIQPLSQHSDFMALMSSEVVALMVQVSNFFDFINSDKGVINLTSSATGGMETVYAVQEVMTSAQANPSNTDIVKDCRKMILDAVSRRLDRINIKMSDIPVGDRYLALSDSLPIKPQHSVVWAAKFLTKGETIPSLKPPILNPAHEAAKPKSCNPKRGENVLLGPQVVGEISMLMQGDIGLVKIDSVPVSSGAMESKLKSMDSHYTYVDMKALCYAKDIGMWRPTKTTGDKYTIQSTDEKSLSTQGSGGQEDNPPPLIYTPRTNTPMVYAKDLQRPKSSAVVESPVAARGKSRRAKSAGFNQNLHNNSLVNMGGGGSGGEMEDLFPEAEAEGDNPVINSDTLHLHDHVHHIRGLTPREESARSTLTLTPTTVTLTPKGQVTGSRLDAVVSDL